MSCLVGLDGLDIVPRSTLICSSLKSSKSHEQGGRSLQPSGPSRCHSCQRPPASGTCTDRWIDQVDNCIQEFAAKQSLSCLLAQTATFGSERQDPSRQIFPRIRAADRTSHSWRLDSVASALPLPLPMPSPVMLLRRLPLLRRILIPQHLG